MSNNYTVKDGLGNSVVFRSTDDGSLNQIPNVRLCDATATNFAPTMDAVARPGFVKVTDGTNTMPTMDVVGRAGFQKVTDGTNTAAVKAASTAAVATDPSLVVSLSPNNAAATNADGSITGGTAASKSLLAGGQFLAYGSLPALTTGQQASLQTDSPGNLKVCVAPMGTPVYGTASSGGAAAANVTLAAVAAKMLYLDGFDIDGLGATAGVAVTVTITGLLGGTLTYLVGIPAGVTVPTHTSFRFNPPLQASAVNTAIAVNVGSFGTGNTASTNNAYGHYV